MRLTKLQPSQRVKGCWLAVLENGDILRLGENEVVDFGLYAGMELDGAAQAALTAAVRRTRVRDRALDLISARPLSRRELMDKLTARPRDREKEPLATEEEAVWAADWLEELGYLDDAAYARTVVEHYARKGYGERKIQDELYRRGVPRDCWDQALEAGEGPETGIDAFLRNKLRGELPDGKTLKRVSDALARRGYRWEDIRDGLRRYGAEVEE